MTAQCLQYISTFNGQLSQVNILNFSLSSGCVRFTFGLFVFIMYDIRIDSNAAKVTKAKLIDLHASRAVRYGTCNSLGTVM